MQTDIITVGDISVTRIVDEHSGKCSCGCGAGEVIRIVAKQGRRSFARSKTFKGESGWSNANRYANDIVFDAQRATGVITSRVFY